MEDESLTAGHLEERPKYTRDQMLLRMDAKLDMLATQLAGKADAAVVESLSHRVAVGELWMAEMKGREQYGGQLLQEFRDGQKDLSDHLRAPHVYTKDVERRRADSSLVGIGVIAAIIAAFGVVASLFIALLK